MKVAIVHDWLTGMRGGERCLEVFCELLPHADLFTLVHFKGSVTSIIEQRKIHTSFLDRLPLVRKKYRALLPLMPSAIEHFNLQSYDRVFSLSHCVAKGVKTRPDARHVCYCFTPVRYVWDMYDQYFPRQSMNFLSRAVVPAVASYIRRWDVRTSGRPNRIIGISNHVRERIHRCWGRDAEVLYPPVDVSRFVSGKNRENFYLMVSAFAPYKRLDIALDAFGQLGLPLKVVGTGQDFERLRRQAPANVEFLGWRSDEDVARLYSKCRAFVFPGEEDFGITPLEAQAAGSPVIALARGGALETVIPHPDCCARTGLLDKAVAPTGVLFGEQTSGSLVEAIRFFEDRLADFSNPAPLRAQAERFSLDIFREAVADVLRQEGVLSNRARQ